MRDEVKKANYWYYKCHYVDWNKPLEFLLYKTLDILLFYMVVRNSFVIMKTRED